jgi:hypothetical protein
MTLRSVTVPPNGAAVTATSPANSSGAESTDNVSAAAPPSDSDRRPSSTAMRRSMPGKCEKGPAAWMRAMLTRQSN